MDVQLERGAASVDDRKERILIAARHVFAKMSYAKATISEIAAEAEVARGSLHYYFKDKEDLFIQVMTSSYDERIGGNVLKQLEAMTPGQLAQITVHFLREGLETTPEFFQIIYESLSVIRQSERVKAALEELWKKYRKDAVVMADGLKDKGVITSQLPSNSLVTLYITLLHGFAIQIMGEPEVAEAEENWKALENALVNLFEK
jgi:AcrR family transcriptional regulator